MDHVIILHRDLMPAMEAARRLGFAPTPIGHHGQALGTMNTTLMFPDRRTYVELLAVTEPTERNASKRRALAERGDHPFGVAFKGDAEAAARHFAAAGIDDGPAFAFARPVARGTTTEDARFAVAPMRSGALPGLYAFVCEQFTPDLVWLGEALRHPNGARRLGGLTGVSADGRRFAEAWQAASGSAAAMTEDETTASTETGDLHLLTEAAWRRRFPMLAVPQGPDPAFALLDIVVDDLQATAALLDANGVPGHEGDDAIVVPDEIGFGAAVRFNTAQA